MASDAAVELSKSYDQSQAQGNPRVSGSATDGSKMTQRGKLSILIPAYNERYSVAAVVERVLAARLPAGMVRELIVVDDGSTDGTQDILEELTKKHAGVMSLYRHAVNRGKGAALRTAITHATGDICIVQDADLEYDPQDYAALLGPIIDGEADVVYGSRFLSGQRRRVLYYWHAVGNRLLTHLSNAFTNLNLTDMETGYKAMRTKILQSIPIRSNGFGIEPELTAKLAKRGCRVFEVAISYRGRTYEEGKKITWWDGIKAIGVILYFWLMDDIYNERYGHAILHRLSKTHRFNRWMAERIKPWVGSAVLEIGAGLGNLTCKLLPRERYVASDADHLHLGYLRNRFAMHPQLSVSAVDLENPAHFEPLAGQFDTVVCLNVLEHVERDEQALDNMFSALQPGGRAIILVPRGQWLFGSLDEALDHQRRYSRGELVHKCEDAGFRVAHCTTFNRAGVPAWFLNGKLLRRRHFGRVQLKLFDSMVWLWRRLDWLLPWKGLSLIVVAQKPQSVSQAP